MRISNSMLTDNFLNNLNKNLEKMVKLQTQLATGKRITKLSDDPMGTIQSMNVRVKINRIEQYKKNIDSAQSWISLSESAVLELNEVVKSAYESAVSSSNDYMTASDKRATAELIGQLRDHIVTVGNSKAGDKFVFSGFNSESLPFKINEATGAIEYNGLDMSNALDPALIAEGAQIIEYEIAYNTTSQISISGTELLGTGDENIYVILDDYYNALQNNASAEELSIYIDKILQAQGRLLNVESKIGGRTNRLELVMTRHDEDLLNYTYIKSKIEDVDQAEAIMRFKMAEGIYTAALQMASSIIQPTLLDFLK